MLTSLAGHKIEIGQVLNFIDLLLQDLLLLFLLLKWCLCLGGSLLLQIERANLFLSIPSTDARLIMI